MRTTWKVAVVPPRTNDGANWQMRILPPPGAKDETGAPLREMRRSAETTDHAKALEQAKQIEQDLNEAFGAQERTFLSVYNAHLDFRRQKGKTAPQTLERYEYVRKTLAPLLELPVAEVTIAAINRFRNSLDLNPNTINSYLSCARKAWRWGAGLDMVPHPWPDVERLERQKNRKKPLKPAQSHAILEWVAHYQEGHWLPIFRFVWETGVRVSEACGVDQHHVDRAGPAPYKVAIQGTKTEAAERRVFITSECLALLPTHPGPVFRGLRRSSERATRHAVKAVMALAARAIGVEGRADFHSFRRTDVTDKTRMADVPEALSMKLSGHVSKPVYLGYQQNAEDEDDVLRGVAEKVLGRRVAALGPVLEAQPQQDSSSLCPRGNGPEGAQAQVGTGLPPSDPPGSRAETSGDGPATPVRKVWEEFEVAETLNAVANLGKSFRSALRQVCGDAALRAALERALDDGWPGESRSSTLMTDTGGDPRSNPLPRPEVG